MERLPMCRICLTENVRLSIVASRNLHELYEKLTDIPFITEDSRPNLACVFCFAKLKQCYRFLRQCPKAEKLFTQRMNDKYEPNTLINENRLEVFGELIKSPVEQINIVGHIAVTEELSAVCEGPDDVIEPKEEYLSDEQEPENLDNSCPDVAGIPPHCDESDFEDDVPLINCKIEVEDEELSNNQRRDRKSLKLEPENLDNSCLDVVGIPPHYNNSDLEDDVPLINCKTEVEDEEVSKKNRRARETTKATLKRNSKQDIRRTIEKDAITTEQTTKDKSYPKVIRTAGKWTFKPGTYFKELCTRHPLSSNKVKKEYKCDVCQRNFIDKTKLTVHIRVHTGEKPYECHICKRNFGRQSSLTVHMRTHTGEKPYECDFCQSNFSRKNHLTEHMLRHTDEKPYECNFCQRNFRQKTSLKRHMLSHTGEKPHKCDLCHCSFSQKCLLSQHMRTHTGEKPHKCDICQRNFGHKSNLTAHMRTHTGEKPYVCNVCHRNFGQKSNLTVHLHTHTGEKPYVCNVCQRHFNQKNCLTRHMRTHTNGKP